MRLYLRNTERFNTAASLKPSVPRTQLTALLQQQPLNVRLTNPHSEASSVKKPPKRRAHSSARFSPSRPNLQRRTRFKLQKTGKAAAVAKPPPMPKNKAAEEQTEPPTIRPPPPPAKRRSKESAAPPPNPMGRSAGTANPGEPRARHRREGRGVLWVHPGSIFFGAHQLPTHPRRQTPSHVFWNTVQHGIP